MTANMELYHALKEAGTSEDLASKAAVSVAGYDARFAAMDIKLERMDGRLNTLTWMVATLMTIMLLFGLGIVWQLLQMQHELGGLAEQVRALAVAVGRIAPP